MSALLNVVGSLVHRDHGATAVEYVLMVGFIATVIASAVALFGQAVAGLFIVPVSAF